LESRLETIRAGLPISTRRDWPARGSAATTSEGPDQAQQIADGLGYQIAYGASFDSGGINSATPLSAKFPIASPRSLHSLRRHARFALSFVCRIDAPFGKLPFFVTH